MELLMHELANTVHEFRLPEQVCLFVVRAYMRLPAYT